MKKQIFIISIWFIFIHSVPLNAQIDSINLHKKNSTHLLDSSLKQPINTDSFYIDKKNIKKQKWVAAGSIIGYGSALAVLDRAWYAQYPRSSFHFYNDNGEWNQIDKIGHGWSAYQLTRASYHVWKWSGVSDKKAILFSGLSGPTFLTVIEILDGFSSKWGFSWGDMAANIGGSSLFITQQLGWKEQRIQFKFSFHKKNYENALEKNRANDLFGSSWSQRMLKDYNAQTYWLSANVRSFAPNARLPKWLNIAVGYSANNMFGGYTNTWTDKNGNQQSILKKRERLFYVSPDIDLSKIKTKSKFLNSLFFCFNSLKMPLPAISIGTDGKLQFYPIHF